MRFALSLLASVALLASVSLAGATAVRADAPFNAKGTLVDVMCGEGMKTQADADGHKRACALSERCASSGFGVFVGGTFHKFDDAGNKQAEAIFKSSKKMDHVTAAVEGTLLDDGTIEVTKITAE